MDQTLTTRNGIPRRSARRLMLAFATLTAMTLLVSGLTLTAPARATTSPGCHETSIPVNVPGIPGARLFGELCLPDGPAPDTVQLLVHGASYTHEYWDWQQQPETYSYARRALDAGYATFAVDRLGAGQSTRPLLATLVNLDNGAKALHQVIVRLRSGQLSGGHEFSNVVWLGHSMGSAQAWVSAEAYPDDIDAYVITGLAHHTNILEALGMLGFQPAAADPKFLGQVLDPLYLTTIAGMRSMFYDTAVADPAVIAYDEQNKDTLSTVELTQVQAMTMIPLPQNGPSQSIDVPTLVVLGAKDVALMSTCAEPDPCDCEQHIVDYETPFYGPGASIQAHIVAGGHDVNLHPGAPETYADILDWIDAQEL